MRRRGGPRGGRRALGRARLVAAGVAALALVAWRLLRVLPGPEGAFDRAGASNPAVLAGCRLARPVDGDSFEARCGGRRHRVRLLRIDTPEYGEPGFAEARRALLAMLREGPFRLEAEGRAFERDRYGRLLAYAWSARGKLVNEEMIRLGWSRFETGFGRGRLAERLRRAEREARRARRGLHRPGLAPSPEAGRIEPPRRPALA